MPPRRYDLLGIGDPVLDVIVHTAQLAAWDDKQLGEAVALSGGGCEANVVCAASRLGLATALVGTVGSDAVGDMLKRQLGAFGVDVAHLATAAQGGSATAVVQVSPRGERAIVYVPAPPAAGDAGCVAPELLAQARCVYTLPYDALRFERLARAAHAARALVAVDVERAVAAAPGVAGLVRTHADVVFFNHQGFAQATGDAPSAAALGRWMGGARAQLAVITRGALGAIGATRGGAPVEQAAFAAKVIDTTGAGDTFNAACLSAWLRGSSLAEALAEGSAAASLGVECVGARDGLPTREQIQRARRERSTLPVEPAMQVTT